MRITKKLLSICLAATLLLSMFALSTVVYSSTDSFERVINDFDDVGRSGFTVQNSADCAIGTFDYTEVDASYEGGNVIRFYSKTSLPNQAFKIDADPTWAKAVPTKIKFKAWTGGTPVTFLETATGIGGAHNSPKYNLTALNAAVTITSEPMWVEYDLTNVDISTLPTVLPLIFKSSSAETVYFDDITMVYASAEDMPLPIVWGTMYDWEVDSVPSYVSNSGTASGSIVTQFSDLTLTTSTKSLKVAKTAWDNKNMTDHVRVELDAEKMATATDLRIVLQNKFTGGSGTGFFGIEVDGVKYWTTSQNTFSKNAYTRFYLTHINIGGFTVTEENLSEVDAILFHPFTAQSQQYLNIDDIEYSFEAEVEEPTTEEPTTEEPTTEEPTTEEPTTEEPTTEEPTTEEPTTEDDENIPELDLTKSHLKVDTVTAKPGSTIEVNVVMGNNPGVWAVKFMLKYDRDVLSIKEYKEGTVFTAGEILSSPLTNEIFTFTAEASKLDANKDTDGVILTLVFEIAEDAVEGEYSIAFTSYSEDSIFDKDFDNKEFTFGNGAIVVSNEEPTTEEPTTEEPTTEEPTTEEPTESTTANEQDTNKFNEIYQAFLDQVTVKLSSDASSADIFNAYIKFLNLYNEANDTVYQLLKDKDIDDLDYFEILSNIIDEFYYATDEDLVAAGLKKDDYYKFMQEFVDLYDSADAEFLEVLKQNGFDTFYESYIEALDEIEDDVDTGSLATPLASTLLAAAAAYVVVKSKKKKKSE